MAVRVELTLDYEGSRADLRGLMSVFEVMDRVLIAAVDISNPYDPPQTPSSQVTRISFASPFEISMVIGASAGAAYQLLSLVRDWRERRRTDRLTNDLREVLLDEVRTIAENNGTRLDERMLGSIAQDLRGFARFGSEDEELFAPLSERMVSFDVAELPDDDADDDEIYVVLDSDSPVVDEEASTDD